MRPTAWRFNGVPEVKISFFNKNNYFSLTVFIQRRLFGSGQRGLSNVRLMQQKKVIKPPTDKRVLLLCFNRKICFFHNNSFNFKFQRKTNSLFAANFSSSSEYDLLLHFLPLIKTLLFSLISYAGETLFVLLITLRSCFFYIYCFFF